MSRVGAWTGYVPVVGSHELRRAPLRVEAEGGAIVLFRDHEGRAGALLDRCPHRFAPLSAGRVRADGRIACPYHGWSFDRGGCGASPSEPERVDCDTVSFGVVERGGVVFVAPPGPREREPEERAPPQATWVSRPVESPLHELGLGKPTRGVLRLARVIPSLGGAPLYRRYRVTRREAEAADIVSFTFEPLEARELFPFRAGQYVMVRLAVTGGRTVTRAYSLSDVTDGARYRISVRRVTSPTDGVASSWLHDHLVVGAEVEVSDPTGEFVVTDPTRPLLFVAGGVGITPIFTMLKSVAEARRSASTTLLYSVRSPADVFRRRELEDLARRAGGAVRCFVTGDATEGAEGFTRGRVDVEALRSCIADDPDVYVCGPAAMIDDVGAALADLGVSPARLHSERFRAALGPLLAALVGPDATDRAPESAEVTFARKKRVLRWTPNEGSLLELAAAHGLALDSGCRVGSCGTCRVRVTRGDVLSTAPPTHDGTCLPCVAVPRGDVVLDA